MIEQPKQVRRASNQNTGFELIASSYKDRVRVRDYVVGIRNSDHDIQGARNFSDFLCQPDSQELIARFIHVCNAPWAIAHLRQKYAIDTEVIQRWMSSNSRSSDPREKVWHVNTDELSTGLQYGFETFIGHTNHKHLCNTDRRLSDLSNAVGGSEGFLSKWDACMQKIGIICLSKTTPSGMDRPINLVVYLSDTQGCPDISDPIGNLQPQLDDITAPVLVNSFFRESLYHTVRPTINHLNALLEGYQDQFAYFEKCIFANPENEIWGDVLWKASQYWNILGRAATRLRRMLSYIEAQGEVFLRESWSKSLRDGTTPGLTAQPIFGKIDLALIAAHDELQNSLIVPTTNMLDMIYKRVAIRDARDSLNLNESLWRLSWITFIFLPLTFISGFFGMNVDIFKDNPSIKWWFITAGPLMVLVLLLWFLFRRSQNKVKQRSRRPFQQSRY